MARYVRIVMLALAIALVLPSVVRSANREYHSHGYQGAPDVGNWAWKNWSSGKHGWWMKQHWVQGSGSYGELRNGHGFEMEWYDGGNKTKCDIFEINPMSVHFWGSGITLLSVEDGCGSIQVKEHAEFRVVSKARIPEAINGVNNDGVAWSMIASTPREPVPCPPPPPGGSCGLPEEAQVNLEWKLGQTWLGKIQLDKCSGPHYRSDWADPSGLAAATGCS